MGSWKCRQSGGIARPTPYLSTMTTALPPTKPPLPLGNKLLFSADHIGLQAIGYFRQQGVLFFLAPLRWKELAACPTCPWSGSTLTPGCWRVYRRVYRLPHRLVERPRPQPVGVSHTLHPVQHAVLCSVRGLVWFLPASGSSWRNALYFVLMLELFFTAATMSSGALEALVPELTPTASDRMNVVSFLFLFAVDGIVQQRGRARWAVDSGYGQSESSSFALRHGPAFLRACSTRLSSRNDPWANHGGC